MVSTIASITSLTFTVGAALMFASVGEVICERSGNLNLGIEGILAIGALVSVFVTVDTGNPYAGFVVAVASGVVFAAIHAYFTISLKSDQVISGIMLTLLGLGVATFLGQLAFPTQVRVDGFGNVTPPFIGEYLVQIPIIGVTLFRNPLIDYIALLSVPLVWFFLNRTNLGLEIKAVGEDPAVADTMGIPVARRRYLAVLIGGGFAGAAGAHLALAVAQIWLSTITAGRGWIAIAIVIFAGWSVVRAMFGAYLFGMIEAVTLSGAVTGSEFLAGTAAGQIISLMTHPSIMRTYPYIVTILVLIVIQYRAGRISGVSAAPNSILKPYIRGGE